jgi:phosphate-selective porin OprO/OprP
MHNVRLLKTIIQYTAILLFVLAVAEVWAAEEPVIEEPATEEPVIADEVNELGEGRKWIPEESFPSVDPGSVEGYVYFWDRDFNIPLPNSNLLLSRKRGLEYTINDSDFYLRVGGRIYLDFVQYFENKNDLGDNGPGIRNVTIEMNGRFTKQWLYRLSWGGFTSGGEFDGTGVFLDDAYLSYIGFEKTAIVVGQQKEPFSLEHMSSSLATTFMERGLPNALVTGTNLGVSFSTYRSWWGLTAGVFSKNFATSTDLSDQGQGFTGHIHFNPGHSEDKTYHLGTSFSARDISDTGSFSVQGEYINARITRDTGFGELDFSGWYVFASWFPTGGSRNYFSNEGIFGYPDIKSKYGEVELAVRYSMLDLTDGLVRGGTEQNITLGINWYLSRKIRLTANYIMVNNDEFANADGTLEGDDDSHILQFRFQYRI